MQPRRRGFFIEAATRVPRFKGLRGAWCRVAGDDLRVTTWGGDMAQISETTLRQQLADCHRMMVMAELLDYSGHVSARIPGTDRILILPRDASRAGVTADDMLVVGLDGQVLAGNSLPPP